MVIVAHKKKMMHFPPFFSYHVAAKAAVGSCSIKVDAVDSSSNSGYYSNPPPEDVEMLKYEGEQCKFMNYKLHSRNRMLHSLMCYCWLIYFNVNFSFYQRHTGLVTLEIGGKWVGGGGGGEWVGACTSRGHKVDY